MIFCLFLNFYSVVFINKLNEQLHVEYMAGGILVLVRTAIVVVLVGLSIT